MKKINWIELNYNIMDTIFIEIEKSLIMKLKNIYSSLYNLFFILKIQFNIIYGRFRVVFEKRKLVTPMIIVL